MRNYYLIMSRRRNNIKIKYSNPLKYLETKYEYKIIGLYND